MSPAHRKCNCGTCKTCSHRQNARRAYRLKAYGQWRPYQDAEPIRQHVRTLMATGIGWRAIADSAGVSREFISSLIYNKQGHIKGRVRGNNAQAVLNVKPQPFLVPAEGTGRRLRALARIGYTSYYIGDRLGVHQGGLRRWYLGEGTVKRATAEKIADLYNELHMTPGPSRSASIRAANKGWLPPLAYDDIDEPDETPSTTSSTSASARSTYVDPVVIERLLRGERIFATKAEQEETVRRIMANPEKTLADFAQLSHLPVRSIAERIHTRNRRAA